MWLYVCVVLGVIAKSLLFLTTVNNGNRGGAAVLAVGAHIEEQMLKLQMLKHRRQRRRSRGWSVGPAEAERVNLQPGLTNAL